MQADECGSTFADIADVPRGDRRWTEIVRPIVDKFTLPAKVGCEVRLDAEAAKSVGQTVTLLAQMLDVCDDDRAARQRLLDDLLEHVRGLRRDRVFLTRLLQGFGALIVLVALMGLA